MKNDFIVDDGRQYNLCSTMTDSLLLSTIIIEKQIQSYIIKGKKNFIHYNYM